MSSLSSVKDPITGSNYGGITQDNLGMNASHKQYLDKLFETTQRPVGGPLRQQQYTPSAGDSPVIGQVSNQTLGSLPIFGSGAAIFPQAVLDQHARAQKDAELQYLNEIGDVSMDQLQMSSTLKNPWHNQAFTNKYQESLDAWLNASASQFGGDYEKGRVALKGNKDYMNMMKSYQDYASIYNSVFDQAVGILAEDPKDTYVSDITRKSAMKFIHDYEQIEDLPIDELVRRARTFKTHMSVNKVADNAMDGLGDRVYDGYQESAEMGTDEMNVYVKTKSKGPKQAEIQEIYDAQLEAYPWIKDDKNAQKLLMAELQKRADKSYEKSIQIIKKDTAAMNTYLTKNGVQVDKDGKVQTIPEVPTAFDQFDNAQYAVGTDAIQYPTKDMSGKPVELATVSGMKAYIIDQSTGNLYYATLPGTHTMTPQKEYTMQDTKQQNNGRFVEGTITFEDTGLYSRDYTKSPTIEGEVQPAVATGGRTTMQQEKRPVMVKDVYTGNQVELYGTYTVVAPFDAMKDELNAVYPFLQRTHADMTDNKARGGIVLPNRPQETNKVQAGTVASSDYATQDEAFADKDNWKKDQTIVVEGVSYKWTGSKLRKQ